MTLRIHLECAAIGCGALVGGIMGGPVLGMGLGLLAIGARAVTWMESGIDQVAARADEIIARGEQQVYFAAHRVLNMAEFCTLSGGFSLAYWGTTHGVVHLCASSGNENLSCNLAGGAHSVCLAVGTILIIKKGLQVIFPGQPQAPVDRHLQQLEGEVAEVALPANAGLGNSARNFVRVTAHSVSEISEAALEVSEAAAKKSEDACHALSNADDHQ